jgi:ribosomal protein L1
MSFTSWIDGRIKVAIDEANVDLKADIQQQLQTLEQNINAKLDGIPGAVISGIGTVALDAEKIAENVTGSLQGFLPNALQNILNPAAIASQVISGIQGLLPHFPGFGSGH